MKEKYVAEFVSKCSEAFQKLQSEVGAIPEIVTTRWNTALEEIRDAVLDKGSEQ